MVAADEKTSIQAPARCHPDPRPGVRATPASRGEYDQGGALAYLAARDVHRAKVMGRCEATTGIAPFGRLVVPRGVKVTVSPTRAR